MKRIWRNDEIERIVETRLIDYESRHGKISSPCVPVDGIIEDCNLKILYDKIEEKPGENILGGLNSKERIIIINESYMGLFKEKPGLERSTKAHELGHWELFVEKSSQEGDLFSYGDIEVEGVCYRESGVGNISVILNAWTDEDVYQVYKAHVSRKDHPNVASAVDRYANSLLMPRDIILSYALRTDLTNWRNLYNLAEMFEVTISAMSVRLQRLGLIHIKDKKIYMAKEECIGQKRFEF